MMILGVSPTLDPFLGMCRTLGANLRTCHSINFNNLSIEHYNLVVYSEQRVTTYISLADKEVEYLASDHGDRYNDLDGAVVR